MRINVSKVCSFAMLKLDTMRATSNYSMFWFGPPVLTYHVMLEMDQVNFLV